MLKQKLTDIMSAAFTAAGYDAAYGKVEYSDRPDLCQFQCNGAFAAAKQYKQNPRAIAAQVLENLQKDSLSLAEVVGAGFINLSVSAQALNDEIAAMASGGRFGIPTQPQQTIMLDYGGANVAKALHVGHLRTANIGEALKRLAQLMGHKTIADVHLGDWGLPMGQIFAYIEQNNIGVTVDGQLADSADVPVPQISVDDLNKIYPKASALSKQDETFKQNAARITAALQAGHKGYYTWWKPIVKMSVDDMRVIYDTLGAQFDLWLGESDAQPYIPILVDLLKSKCILYESDGAMVVDVAESDDTTTIPPILITKSNGAALYPATDVATILQREKDYNPDKIWYFTDNRQSLHFTQVFRCCRKAGILPNGEMQFFGFGTMNGKDGKPYKTRDGGIMTLSAFIKELYDAAYEKINDAALTSDERADIAQKVAIAALKYADLANDMRKDYIFDIDRFVSFEGKTGPYILYTIVRINSILKKAEELGLTKSAFLPPQSETQTELMLTLSTVGERMEAAFNDKNLSMICELMYNIAATFNKFYIDHKIIPEQDAALRGSWLSLCALVKDTLSLMCNTLAIEIPNKM